jgi:hypothetical protein
MEGTDATKTRGGKRATVGRVNQCQKCSAWFHASWSKTKFCQSCRPVAEMMTCVVCGTVRRRWASGGRSAGLCCSKKCGGVLRTMRAKERRLADPYRLKPLLEFCRKLIEEEKKAYVRSCLALAGWMHEWDKRPRARRQRNRQKPKGSRKHASRARRRGLPRSFRRSMSIDAVGNRDRWVCQLCACPIVDRHGRGSPFSPCVDHIVPINHPRNATHGHTEDNVQIAHRRCNEAKGCSVACESLLTCDNPRKWLSVAKIDQTPGVGRNTKTKEKTKTPGPLCASSCRVFENWRSTWVPEVPSLTPGAADPRPAGTRGRRSRRRPGRPMPPRLPANCRRPRTSPPCRRRSPSGGPSPHP